MFIDVMMLEKKNCQHIESVSSENNMFGSSCVASKVGKCFVLWVSDHLYVIEYHVC